jgi:uncharacterized protein (TIGR02646 family)
MIRIEFVEPVDDSRWQDWLADCREETQRLVRAVEQDGEKVEIGDLYKRDSIKSKHYHAGKKGARPPFHGKCVFCEDSREMLHVEHFRPKKSVKEAPEHRGYYWLAYDHHNLLLACEDCNVGRKQDRFPLEDERTRAWTSTDDLASETPLLLNPLVDEPRKHLRINLETGVLFGKTTRGKTCIEVLGLNRDKLREGRKEHAWSIRARWLVATRPQASERERERASQYLVECFEGRRPFTLTARAQLERLIPRSNK